MMNHATFRSVTRILNWLIMMCATAGTLIITTAPFAQPAPSSNYTSFDAVAGTRVQIAYYASAHKNCTPAELPEIRVVEAPRSGTLTLRRGAVTTNKIEACPGLRAPAQVVFYEARQGSVGTDHFVYKVRNPNGEVGLYDVTINIQQPPKQIAVPDSSRT